MSQYIADIITLEMPVFANSPLPEGSDFPWCSLGLFLLVLSLVTWGKRLTVTSLQPPFRAIHGAPHQEHHLSEKPKLLEIHVNSLGLASPLPVLLVSLQISVAKFEPFIKYSQGKCHSVFSLLNLLNHLHTTVLFSKQDLTHGSATRDRFFILSLFWPQFVCFCILKVTMLG